MPLGYVQTLDNKIQWAKFYLHATKIAKARASDAMLRYMEAGMLKGQSGDEEWKEYIHHFFNAKACRRAAVGYLKEIYGPGRSFN